MSDTTAADVPAPPTSATGTDETPTAGTETHGEAEGDAQGETRRFPNSRRESAYRQRAQEAESAAQWLVAERDAHLAGLRNQVEAFQRADVERIAAGHIRDGGDIWSTGATLDGFLDDAGQLDTVKVAEVAHNLALEKPHWRRPGSTERASTVTGNERIGMGKAAPSFADAFRPK